MAVDASDDVKLCVDADSFVEVHERTVDRDNVALYCTSISIRNDDLTELCTKYRVLFSDLVNMVASIAKQAKTIWEARTGIHGGSE